MEGDPTFRLKVFVVVAGVLGVFLVAFVAQRGWYWLRTRKREDIETSRLEPIFDFGLLAVGLAVIWVALEGLIVAYGLAPFARRPMERRKIAEIEVGRVDPETGRLTFLFYPVDEAGERRRERRVPVFTSGGRFELEVEVVEWRDSWEWLGGPGEFRFKGLSGYDDKEGAATADRRDLSSGSAPGGLGGWLFLKPSTVWSAVPEKACLQGEVFDIYLGERLEVEPHPAESP